MAIIGPSPSNRISGTAYMGSDYGMTRWEYDPVTGQAWMYGPSGVTTRQFDPGLKQDDMRRKIEGGGVSWTGTGEPAGTRSSTVLSPANGATPVPGATLTPDSAGPGGPGVTQMPNTLAARNAYANGELGLFGSATAMAAFVDNVLSMYMDAGYSRGQATSLAEEEVRSIPQAAPKQGPAGPGGGPGTGPFDDFVTGDGLGGSPEDIAEHFAELEGTAEGRADILGEATRSQYPGASNPFQAFLGRQGDRYFNQYALQGLGGGASPNYGAFLRGGNRDLLSQEAMGSSLERLGGMLSAPDTAGMTEAEMEWLPFFEQGANQYNTALQSSLGKVPGAARKFYQNRALDAFNDFTVNNPETGGWLNQWLGRGRRFF